MALKEIRQDELFSMFDSDVHEAINTAIEKAKATAVVVFENMDLSSSHLGERTAMVVGASCTYKTVEDCEGHWLNDLPSVRQYATCFWQIQS